MNSNNEHTMDLSFDFSGRAVLITGAAQGLGFAMAEMFSDSGAKVVLVDIDPGVKQAAESLSRNGAEALGEIADVTDRDSIVAMQQRVAQQFGKIDTLINNTGKYLPQTISEISSDDFDQLIAINLKSTFLVTQVFMSDLKSHEDGRIVNIASSDAYVAKVTNAHYAAAKAGVVSLTKTFAAELAPNVLVNGVSPGPIMTETAKSQGWLVKAIERSPLGRAAAPQDIGTVVLFLASKANRFMSGETVVVNGGHTMV
ncbi:MAG: 3-oxoacyl-[acyl-carrier protein] reductase [Parasphingorhabdus sp.]|jgi:3-oxoacyl-[acyl-carrier protein] reductase